LRLIWTSDMEWKGDENQMFEMAKDAAKKGWLPQVGMESGGGIVNPALSVGIFAIAANFTNDPLAINTVVQIINVVAILCFLLFIFSKIDINEREVWLMGIVLASVSPLAVLFSRKIWAQDLLPIFSFFMIYTNYNRSKKWGAFLWGFSAALIGQIHMSGFFIAFGLFVFSVIYDYYNKRKFQWIYWIAGSIAGSITLIPWIMFLLSNPQPTKLSFWHIFQFNFYFHWFLDSLGLNIYYSLRKDFWLYIREPVISGVPTYLAALAHLFLIVMGFFTLNIIKKYVVKTYRLLKEKTISFKDFFIGISITKFYLFSILLGLGVFLTLSGTTIFQHYIICAFPFTYIFISKIFQHKRKLFYSIILAQMLITITFLLFIHKNNGAVHGDYGRAYHTQIEAKK